jgi:hypothetical protein
MTLMCLFLLVAVRQIKMRWFYFSFMVAARRIYHGFCKLGFLPIAAGL